MLRDANWRKGGIRFIGLVVRDSAFLQLAAASVAWWPDDSTTSHDKAIAPVAAS